MIVQVDPKGLVTTRDRAESLLHFLRLQGKPQDAALPAFSHFRNLFDHCPTIVGEVSGSGRSEFMIIPNMALPTTSRDHRVR